MGVEIEKKYRITQAERERVEKRLHEVGAQLQGEEFEENTLYAGNNLNTETCVLRLRRTEKVALLTYKERTPTTSAIKHQREDETAVEDPEALAAILDALGYKPALTYEKRRATWRFSDNTEVVIDELPFGFFMEIEGDEQGIAEAERLLDLYGIEAELATYPDLVEQHGLKSKQGVVEARFK